MSAAIDLERADEWKGSIAQQGGHPEPEKSREFRCDECRARCTRGLEGTEYGHAYGCPERPGHLPAGDTVQYGRQGRDAK